MASTAKKPKTIVKVAEKKNVAQTRVGNKKGRVPPKKEDKKVESSEDRENRIALLKVWYAGQKT